MKIPLIFSILFMLSCMSISAQSLELKAYALHNKTEQVKVVDNIKGLNIAGFDPQYGYQGGVSYTQLLYKSFIINGEIGYLAKGYNTIDRRTNKKTLAVIYKYIYIKPSVGYQWRGLSISGGVFLNFLLNKTEVTKSWSDSVFPKPEIASSFELSYQYKKVGLSISTNQNIAPMRTITFFGNEFTHYHHWVTFGLSYTLFNKK